MSLVPQKTRRGTRVCSGHHARHNSACTRASLAVKICFSLNLFHVWGLWGRDRRSTQRPKPQLIPELCLRPVPAFFHAPQDIVDVLLTPHGWRLICPFCGARLRVFAALRFECEALSMASWCGVGVRLLFLSSSVGQLP